ncbi:MAG: metal-dependent hydrolase [Bdellovibrionota bacterium]
MEFPVANPAVANTPPVPRQIQIPNRKTRKQGIQGTRLPDGAAIDVRRMDVNAVQECPDYGYASDPIVSHFFHMLSILFPEGELFFMDSVRNYRKRITDPVLKEQVKAFLGQEALHTKEHVAYNKRLEKLGVDFDFLDKWLHIGFKAMRRLPQKDQLAMTALMEHFTATLADEVLKNPAAQAVLHESIRPLWLWHAVEETEHKAVAFDVYRAMGGSEARRLWAVPLTIATVGPMAVGVFFYLLYVDGQLTNRRSWKRLGNVLFRKPGVLRRTGPRLAGYRRMGFHPWHHDNYQRIQTWKDRFAGQYAVV